jgi:hypothetical protein
MRFRSWREIRRGPRAAIAIVATLLCAFGVWLFRAGGFLPRPSPAVQANSSVVQAVSFADRELPRPAARNPDSAGAWSATENGECGKGEFRVNVVNGFPDPDLPPSIYQAAQDSLLNLAKQVAGSSVPKERALGELIEMMAGLSGVQQTPGNVVSACSPNDEQCHAEVSRARAEAVRPHADAIARIASTTNQPDVYALGFYACGWSGAFSEEGRCALLSAGQWARVEPDNAFPWFLAADAAAKRGDLAARNEAFFRASKAAHLDSHQSVFADLMRSDPMRPEASEAQTGIAITIMGIVAARPFPWYRSLLSFCGANEVSEPNRRQVCSDLAELMTDRSDLQSHLTAGMRIAERVGWPENRLAALRDRRDALMQISMQRLAAKTTSDRCGSFANLSASMAKVLRLGDMEAGRQYLAASGSTVAQLAQAWRAQRSTNTNRR